MALSRLIHTDKSHFLTLRIWERPRRSVTEAALLTADGKPARFILTAHWSDNDRFLGERGYATRDEALAQIAAVKRANED